MRGRGLTIASALIGLAGVVLLLLESINTFDGHSLGTVSMVLLWVGLGLVVLAGILLVVAVSLANDVVYVIEEDEADEDEDDEQLVGSDN